jgi:hypothetical protein
MAKKAERIAREARIACEKWRQYFKYNIDKYHKMHNFVLGHQWEEEEEDMLVTNKKVPLTSNKLATMGNSLLGEQQQNTPQLEVIPMTNCDEETAYLREIILKDIVFSTSAHTVYQVAAAQAFIGSFGAYLIDTDYVHSKSFDQDIVYRSFKDSTRCYWDIGAEKPNKTDGVVGGYIARLTRQKFRDIYGKDIEQKILVDSSITPTKQEIALAVQPDISDDPFSWADDESITINHYYKRKFEKETLYKLSNGKILNQEEMDLLIDRSAAANELTSIDTMNDMMPIDISGMEASQELMDDESMVEVNEEVPLEAEEEMTLWDEGEPVRIEEKRQIKRSRIIHYIIAGDYVLDESEFPAEDIPVIFVDQNSYFEKDGKQVCRSFFDDCVDTQRYINYLRTQSAYILKISRYDQFMLSKENVRGLDTQRIWQNPTDIQGGLAYDESPQGNKPEQLRPPELSQSLFTQYQLAIEDLYTSTGLYPTRMGQEGNEISAKAINARTRQGSYATQVAFNSIDRAIEAGGKIINQMIPRVYDAERVISLMTPDKGMQTLTINKQSDAYGALIENDIRKGTYEVRLKPGPSYEGQKQEALMSLQQVLQANPTTFNLIADLYADNLPLANSIELKNRLKTMVPPQIIEAGKTGKMPQEMGMNQPSPEEQAMQAQMQAKQQELALKQQELQLKAQQQQIEMQIELQKLETERLEVAGKLEEQKLRYLAETERTQSDNAIAHADNLTKILTHRM